MLLTVVHSATELLGPHSCHHCPGYNNKLVYIEAVQAMALLAKLPPQMEEIMCSYNQKTINTMTLTFVTIHNYWNKDLIQACAM